jgi:hypothetical protein
MTNRQNYVAILTTALVSALIDSLPVRIGVLFQKYYFFGLNDVDGVPICPG